MTTLGSTVEDDRHIRQDVLIIEVLQLGQSAAVETASTQDEDRQVCDTVCDSCVSYATEGHVVEEHEVKLLSELRSQLIKTLSEEKLSRIGRYRTRDDDLQLRCIGILAEDLLKSYIGISEVLGSPRTSKTDVRLDQILRKDPNASKLQVITSGAVPPNPAELLLGERLDELAAKLAEQFDFVLFDNVPFGSVADAAIANRIADLTIFVLRAGRLDRRALPELQHR